MKGDETRIGVVLKRVPVGFDAEVGAVWRGFRNPHGAETCAACDGSGYNPGTKKISDTFYDLGHFGVFGTRSPDAWCDKITQDEADALAKAGRLHEMTHDWDAAARKWVRKKGRRKVTAEEVNAANRTGSMMTHHDAINRGILVETRARRLRVWGLCKVCRGGGSVWAKARRRAHAAWRPTEPPVGEAFQLWLAESAGRPLSPVFRFAADLVRWCRENARAEYVPVKTEQEWWVLVLEK